MVTVMGLYTKNTTFTTNEIYCESNFKAQKETEINVEICTISGQFCDTFI